jgi:hypothetical protein
MLGLIPALTLAAGFLFSIDIFATDSTRECAAAHVYSRHRDRVYRGMLPPMLYSIGVVRVTIDPTGNVSEIEWLRKPSHIEVALDIESLILSSAPYPIPGEVYIETWLWDVSGKFQLKSMTEGQK